MGILDFFTEKSDYNIQCYNRTLKNLIDLCCNSERGYTGCIHYESAAIDCIRKFLHLREVFQKILLDGYKSHKTDVSCEIPDYQTFLSLQQKMKDSPEHYKNKTVCVEGYVAYSIGEYEKWDHDSAAVWIYPLPFKTNAEKEICFALVDELNLTKSISLCSDQPLPKEEGLHIRVYGIPYFYTAWDGGKGEDVRILVDKFFVL